MIPAITGARLPAKPPRPPKLQHADYEFLPAALEILEQPLSPIRRALNLTLCGFVAAALTWSYFSKVDIIAVADGKIQAVGRTKVIQPVETGKVAMVAVHDGDAVKAGDLLMQLDLGDAHADEAAVRADLWSERAEAARRRLALTLANRRALGMPVPPVAFPPGTPAEVAEREQRVLAGEMAQLAASVGSLQGEAGQKAAERQRLAATIKAQEALVATLQQRVDMRTQLLALNAESKAKVIDALEVVQSQATTLAGEKGQLGEIDAALSRIGQDIDKSLASFTAENAQKLADAERQADENSRKLDKAKVRTAHMELRSPIDGTVAGLAVTAPGQVVTTGQSVMQIVPRGSQLEIESYLPNADIGFVHENQEASVKVEAFPFTDYGTIPATVTRVAADAIPKPEADQRQGNPSTPAGGDALFGGAQHTQNLVFPVTLRLDRTTMTAANAGGQAVPLAPGMTVAVEIKTGTRRILSYIFSPLVEVAGTAFRER